MLAIRCEGSGWLTCGCGPRWCGPGAARPSGSCGPCPGRAACSQPCSHGGVLRSRHQLKPGIITLATWLDQNIMMVFTKPLTSEKNQRKSIKIFACLDLKSHQKNLTRPHDVKNVTSPPLCLVSVSLHNKYFPTPVFSLVTPQYSWSQ